MRHVVIVGFGMVGARLAEEIRRRDPVADKVRLTVIGAEPHPAYNRVLLSAVAAGHMSVDSIVTHDAAWADRHHIALRTGSRVAAIDSDARRITLDDGSGLTYDDLVMATGSRARLPPIDGLSTQDSRVAVLRTIEDCRNIDRLCSTGRHLAVLGGGVLGLELARGLAGKGMRVTVVHPAGHLMDRQLDAGAGRVLGGILQRQAVELRTGNRAVCWESGAGLRLDDGSLLCCDSVVVTTGAAPETALAVAAGLVVDNGIVIDDQLRTSRAGIYAIGDCAQHGGIVSGLVQPGWEQANILAELLAGANPGARYQGARCVTRLKAAGIELAAMGLRDEPGDAEVLTFADSTRGRYAKLMLVADRVVGAILLGLPDAAATITQLFDRDAPAPTDRLALLLGRALPPDAPPIAAPFRLPAQAIICRCNTVTKRQLVTAWQAGARDVDALATATRATTGCGGCRDAVCGIQEWLANADPVNEADPVDALEPERVAS